MYINSKRFLSNVKAFTTLSGMDIAVKKLSEAYVQIDDVKTMDILETAAALSTNQTSFTEYSSAAAAQGLDVVNYNRELLYRVNQTIALIDTKCQFSSIYQYNIAASPIDAAKVFSPSIDSSAPIDNSVLGGAYAYNVTPIISAVGTVNLYSSKTKTAGSLVIIPKSRDKEEKIVSDFMYSSRLAKASDGYRDRNHANVPSLLIHERKKVVVFENDYLGQLTIV